MAILDINLSNFNSNLRKHMLSITSSKWIFNPKASILSSLILSFYWDELHFDQRLLSTYILD
jgi:uncharacterized membrane protein